MQIPTRLIRIRNITFNAARRFDHERGFEAAAALAFYSVASLFPLLLLLITGASLLIEEQDAKKRVLETLFEFTPNLSQQMIKKNIEQVLEHREGFSVAAVLTLIWTASGVFSGLVENINRAWIKNHFQTVLRNRLLAIATGFALFMLLLSLFITQHVISAVKSVQWASNSVVAILIPSSRLLTVVFGFISLLMLYKLVPSGAVRWREAAAGALVSSGAAELVTAIYGIYLSSRFQQYNLIYGSLATILGFMFWTYAIHVIVLFGAHVSAQTAGAPST
ncbi:MAG: YihY/virulence factor BrkB family protein [Deltaproteobacteria bacterium]|nr:YihY/virulence factor BrkB family protein [Deltaproteobacteria bacterium]